MLCHFSVSKHRFLTSKRVEAHKPVTQTLFFISHRKVETGDHGSALRYLACTNLGVYVWKPQTLILKYCEMTMKDHRPT